MVASWCHNRKVGACRNNTSPMGGVILQPCHRRICLMVVIFWRLMSLNPLAILSKLGLVLDEWRRFQYRRFRCVSIVGQGDALSGALWVGFGIILAGLSDNLLLILLYRIWNILLISQLRRGLQPFVTSTGFCSWAHEFTSVGLGSDPLVLTRAGHLSLFFPD